MLAHSWVTNQNPHDRGGTPICKTKYRGESGSEVTSGTLVIGISVEVLDDDVAVRL